MKSHDSVLHVAGLDVGYGAVKLVHGRVTLGSLEQLEPKERILPVGAAPESQIAVGYATPGNHVPVVVNGQRWIAGVSPMAVQSSQVRQLHKDYSATEEYMALFLTALAQVGTDVIDLLVTGLPTEQALDKQFSQKLAARMKGKHPLNGDRVVEVRKAVVVPQPLGGYQDLLTRDPSVGRIDDQYMLVLDPGFFSLDWIVMMGRRPLAQHSSSSTDGWSRVLELTRDELIKSAPGYPLSISRLDEAVRRKTYREFSMGNLGPFDLEPLFRKHGGVVARQGLTAVKLALRNLADAMDHIVICGGAAEYFVEAVKEAFPYAKIDVSDRPQFANARGFFRFGVLMTMQETKQVA